ncbi:MAG: hypothetical protein KDC14_09840 [Planctomycetes bacterium]|nr:hypothetical protein [Planctomycetota bacterium]
MTILLALSVLVGTALPASGALPPQDAKTPAQSVTQDSNAEDRRRVLHLTDGRVLRGRSKLVDESWSVRVDGAWIDVPASEVERTRVERELLAEAAKLARDIEKDDLERRVIYADWLADQGLFDESLDELDRVLRADPDHSGVLTLIARRTYPLERARGRELDVELYKDLVLAGGAARPVERELILALLERSFGRETMAKTFAHELTALGNTRREFATLAYRRVLVGEEVRELLRRCALDGSTAVREGAARALAATGETGMTLPLIRALGSESAAVRTNSAESLGVLAKTLGPAATALAAPALVNRYSALAQGGGVTRPPAAHIYIGKQFAYVGDFDVEIAQGSSIADPIVMVGEEGALLDVRLGGISGWTIVREARALRGSLEMLSGEKRGASADAWEAWLAERAK